jgi:pyruvate/2-oxoglutarate dehydrogenase complex dihydrolipoamide acyltransferase (E2) component
MPVRKLIRSGSEDGGGSRPIHVDDADVDIFVESLLGNQSGADGGQSAAAHGDKGKQQEQRCAWPPAPPASRLQQSTADVIAALHEAKQELAKEMEANLKQLKAVLQETQRIAKDMEAVLSEAKGQPKQDEEDEQSARGKQEPWNPPTLKKQAAKSDQDEDEAQSDDQDEQSDDENEESPPQWEPPVDLHAQH